MPPATPTRRDLRPLLFHFPPSEPSAALFSPAKGAGGASSACSQHGALPSPGSPSPRWRHAMCLSDPAMAVLVGGEGVDQRSCKDALWKLEVGKEFGAVRGNGMLMGGWESRMTWVGGVSSGVCAKAGAGWICLACESLSRSMHPLSPFRYCFSLPHPPSITFLHLCFYPILH